MTFLRDLREDRRTQYGLRPRQYKGIGYRNILSYFSVEQYDTFLSDNHIDSAGHVMKSVVIHMEGL